jgi:hypothetical protein
VDLDGNKVGPQVATQDGNKVAAAVTLGGNKAAAATQVGSKEVEAARVIPAVVVVALGGSKEEVEVAPVGKL